MRTAADRELAPPLYPCGSNCIVYFWSPDDVSVVAKKRGGDFCLSVRASMMGVVMPPPLPIWVSVEVWQLVKA